MKVAIVMGVRTPFCRANGLFKELKAKDLGAFAVRELLARMPVKNEEVDELIFGNVIQPPDDTNLARIIAVMGGLPLSCPAFTVNRNCASGLEAIVTASNQILLGKSKIVIAGGAESMSFFPLSYPAKMRDFLRRLQKAKTFWDKLKVAFSFRPSFVIPQAPELKDPLCGLTMGQTAEVISGELKVTRQEQDEYALLSQERASKADFSDEIVPIPLPPTFERFQTVDDGPRANQKIEELAALKPVFEKVTGQVTAGNSSQITDGAACLLLMSDEEVKKRGITPLGYVVDTASVALEPSRMGLGPILAINKLLERNQLKIEDIDLFEINEAFAAQIVAIEKSFKGKLEREKLNVHGGAVALGHPIGASGTRIVLTLLLEMRRRGLKRGIASLCIGGGQGEAILLEGAS